MIVFKRSTKRAMRSSLLLSYSYLHIVHIVLSAGSQQKNNKSYQWNFLKVVLLKCSTKGALNSFFHRKHCTQLTISRKSCTQLTISRKSAKTQCLSEFFQVLILSVILSQSNWFKELCKCSNEQLLSQSALCLIFQQQIIGKNAMLRNSVPSADKIYL